MQTSADAQHLHPGRRVHQYHQCLPVLVTNRFPSWWQTNHCKQLQLPLKTSSDEEADREVEAICAPSEYYRVRSHLHRRRRYLMYNALDDIGEITQYKRPRNNSPSVQGPLSNTRI